ncbi:glycosyl transferase [Neocallimastix lanati (nom. inval.)]|uniref:Glycosyl transferase n=1 Tax=Neocallimastix californiae TaxID=1754190 RepID=A0A1Y2BZY1_9FUNG|nr:glycosyl transferase [Neocallimastix sp. JGI-2020a]ORY40321.1 glycosyl transferase [Neocallimastix californiae]|eukprot:ORY40321.1 glycosyl transferase [Neocallimastix californiae]
MFKIKRFLKLSFVFVFILICYKIIFTVVNSNQKLRKTEELEEDYSYIYRKNETEIKACIFILCQDKDQEKLIKTIHELEETFPHKYPYILLNDVPFSETFKTAISNAVSSRAYFGLIDEEHWSLPKGMKSSDVGKDLIPGKFVLNNRLNYRHMCRFESGFFYNHPMLKPFDYYWRVEPGVGFHCKLDEDPFKFMRDNNKIYGYVISLIELASTVPTLWKAVYEFMGKYPQYITHPNSLYFLSDDHGSTWNYCHFWSNFEIADMRFFRSEAYETFFKFLDEKGGFFYERWGDAPVHSIAASLFLEPDKIHFFKNIGYTHWPVTYCPSDPEISKKCKCPKIIDKARDACNNRLWKIQKQLYGTEN